MVYNALIPELIVSNIEQSKVFYIDVLGFNIEYERPEDRFVFISLGDIQLMLEEASKTELSGLKYPFGKGVNFSFGVDDVEKLYHRVKAKNYPIRRKLEKRRFRVKDQLLEPNEFALLDPVIHQQYSPTYVAAYLVACLWWGAQLRRRSALSLMFQNIVGHC